MLLTMIYAMTSNPLHSLCRQLMH